MLCGLSKIFSTVHLSLPEACLFKCSESVSLPLVISYVAVVTGNNSFFKMIQYNWKNYAPGKLLLLTIIAPSLVAKADTLFLTCVIFCSCLTGLDPHEFLNSTQPKSRFKPKISVSLET